MLTCGELKAESVKAVNPSHSLTLKKRLPGSGTKFSEKPAVEQEVVILPDGKVEIPWITPEATGLVLAVWRAVSDEPFPVRVLSGNIYCG